MHRGLLGLIAVGIVLALAAPAAAAGPGLRAGAAAADITPPIGTPMFAYTDRSRVFNPANNTDVLQVLADPDQHLYAKTFVPSRGFHTRLLARALVIERRGAPYALAQVDLGGIPYAVTRAVAERIRSTGITQDRLLISATHTHAGHGAIWPYEDNSAYGFVGGDVFDRRIFDLTVEGIADAILKAHRSRRPARAAVASVPVLDASRNRSPEAYQRNPEAKDASIPSQDPDVTVIRVDTRRGRPIAVWSNFAVHPTSIGDPILSGENPGATARIVEDEIGQGVVNVWTNGSAGDISPNTAPDVIGEGDAKQPVQYVNGGIAGSEMAGRRVARGVLGAWRAAGGRLSSDLELRAEQGYLPFDGTPADGEPVGPVPVLGAGGITAPDGTCAPVDGMAGPGQGRKMFLFGAPGIVPDVAPVSVWQVGGLGIVATPSELTRTMGARIRAVVAEAAGGAVSRVVTAGLTDAYLSYAATPEEYDACHYEGAMTLFGRRQGPRYRDYAQRLAAHVFAGGAMPAGAPEPAQTGLGVTQDTGFKETPDAGTVLLQPEETVTRVGRATFRWKGGDRALEAPRGRAWVRLERRSGARWRTVATDDSLADLVMRVGPEQYEETYVFSACHRLGTYRFRVTGRALRNGTVRPYQVASRPFRLDPAELEVDQPVVTGGVAAVRARYPDPGAEALIVLPRLVTTGVARLLVDGRPVTAAPEAASGAFTAPVADGAIVSVRSVEDACGNAGA